MRRCVARILRRILGAYHGPTIHTNGASASTSANPDSDESINVVPARANGGGGF